MSSPVKPARKPTASKVRAGAAGGAGGAVALGPALVEVIDQVFYPGSPEPPALMAQLVIAGCAALVAWLAGRFKTERRFFPHPPAA